jgi:hypothetical protein
MLGCYKFLVKESHSPEAKQLQVEDPEYIVDGATRVVWDTPGDSRARECQGKGGKGGL